ncbi:pentatricopeptide repeat-containing protein [Canna indica]|uniref:Pentatricopeptide repeat-containing protein n=1 Tax=Canna indica TaxID=4628 RepID=A0AAQ3Q273_9LILI|nr:pentatricopeptide repeat-containing protein [Canna indica]
MVVVEKRLTSDGLAEGANNGVVNGKDLSHTIRGESVVERTKDYSQLKKGLIAIVSDFNYNCLSHICVFNPLKQINLKDEFFHVLAKKGIKASSTCPSRYLGAKLVTAGLEESSVGKELARGAPGVCEDGKGAEAAGGGVEESRVGRAVTAADGEGAVPEVNAASVTGEEEAGGTDDSAVQEDDGAEPRHGRMHGGDADVLQHHLPRAWELVPEAWECKHNKGDKEKEEAIRIHCHDCHVRLPKEIGSGILYITSRWRSTVFCSRRVGGLQPVVVVYVHHREAKRGNLLHGERSGPGVGLSEEHTRAGLVGHRSRCPPHEILCDMSASPELVSVVLSCLRNDWAAAFTFFLWAEVQPGYSYSVRQYDAMISIPDKMRRFDTADRRSTR